MLLHGFYLFFLKDRIRFLCIYSRQTKRPAVIIAGRDMSTKVESITQA